MLKSDGFHFETHRFLYATEGGINEKRQHTETPC